MMNILNKIKRGEIEMKPKWHFVLKTAGVVLSCLAILLIILFISSFILFNLRLQGGLYLLKFGFSGLMPFFFSVPWLIFLLLLVLIVVLEAVARKFSLVYRKPLLYSLLGLVFLSLFGGFLIDKTPMHPALLMRAEKDQLPLVGPMYRGYRAPGMEDAYRGTISEILDKGFALEVRDGKVFNVIIDSKTKLRPDMEIKVDETAMVWGEVDGDNIKAFGVVIIDDHLKEFLRERQPIDEPGLSHKKLQK